MENQGNIQGKKERVSREMLKLKRPNQKTRKSKKTL